MGTGYLRDLFRGHPSALQLLSEIQHFYGDTLQVLAKETDDDDTSNYAIDCDTTNLIYRKASITLNTRSDRVPAAACHEALHLQLFAKAFPNLRAFQLTSLQARVGQNLEVFMKAVVNVVYHIIFLDDFLTIGFPRSQFVTPTKSEAQPNFEREAKQTKRDGINPEMLWYLNIWWSMHYFTSFCSFRIGETGSELRTEEIQKWGQDLLPDFGQRAAEMRQWLDRGVYRQSEVFSTALRQLASIMQFPPITFYVLRAKDQGGPLMEASP